MPNPRITPAIHYALHAMLGAALGLFSSIIFLLIYYGQRFSVPVSDDIRFRSAFLSTALILFAIICIIYHKWILAQLKMIAESPTDEE
jgi:hypothetical protein